MGREVSGTKHSNPYAIKLWVEEKKKGSCPEKKPV